MNVFGRFSALDLERMTHNEPPWQEARGDLEPDVSCSRRIEIESLKKYFKRLANEC